MDSFKGVTHEDIYSMKNSRYDVFYKVLFHLQISTNFNACKNLVENFFKEKPSISLKSAYFRLEYVVVWYFLSFCKDGFKRKRRV